MIIDPMLPPPPITDTIKQQQGAGTKTELCQPAKATGNILCTAMAMTLNAAADSSHLKQLNWKNKWDQHLVVLIITRKTKIHLKPW